MARYRRKKRGGQTRSAPAVPCLPTRRQVGEGLGLVGMDGEEDEDDGVLASVVRSFEDLCKEHMDNLLHEHSKHANDMGTYSVAVPP